MSFPESKAKALRKEQNKRNHGENTQAKVLFENEP
jgi:hypothetical protein